MTALSGGDGAGDASSSILPVVEGPDATFGGARAQSRSLLEIFPSPADAIRGPRIREAWLAFGVEMDSTIRTVFDGRRSAPEIAYLIGEIVHNYFRARSVTLTSLELRQRIADLLRRLRHERAGGPALVPATLGPSLVIFAFEPSTESRWTGDEIAVPKLTWPDCAFEVPTSALVILASHDVASKGSLSAL